MGPGSAAHRYWTMLRIAREALRCVRGTIERMPMRFAAIADVHGNHLALEAVLADIRAQDITDIVNLGDMLSGPLDARRTIELLMKLDAVHVLGNHDRYLLDETHPISVRTATACRAESRRPTALPSQREKRIFAHVLREGRARARPVKSVSSKASRQTRDMPLQRKRPAFRRPLSKNNRYQGTDQTAEVIHC
jgi:predicted MPP superfamily phosphohydrolase